MIDVFNGYYGFLSNFHVIDIMVNDRLWRTSEHMFMAGKTDDPELQEQIRLQTTPGRAKRLGRRIQLREGWDEMKDAHMLYCLRKKFTLNTKMQVLLLETGDKHLCEGNKWHDNYWGSCTCWKCGNQGRNMLGQLLMQVRSEL